MIDPPVGAHFVGGVLKDGEEPKTLLRTTESIGRLLSKTPATFVRRPFAAEGNVLTKIYRHRNWQELFLSSFAMTLPKCHLKCKQILSPLDFLKTCHIFF